MKNFALILLMVFTLGCTEGDIVPGFKFYPDGDMMDNGRLDGDDDIIWLFQWPKQPNAEGYQLFVKASTAINPVIETNVTTNSYRHVSPGSYIVARNRHGWEWKVRYYVDGEWLDWMETHTFYVEPVNTDPPKGG